LGLIGAGLLLGGASGVAMGAQLFGVARSHRDLFTPAVVRWWGDGGWGSDAVVLVLGLSAAVAGVLLGRVQLRPSGGSRLAPTITLFTGSTESDGIRGVVTVRTSGLIRGVRRDLEQLAGVQRAAVELSGVYPDFEMRATLDVDGASDLPTLTKRVEERLARLDHTVGIKPHVTRVNISLRQAEQRRRLAWTSAPPAKAGQAGR
jgi:hypothetical protein